jgi:hypothetical protein
MTPTDAINDNMTNTECPCELAEVAGNLLDTAFGQMNTAVALVTGWLHSGQLDLETLKLHHNLDRSQVVRMRALLLGLSEAYRKAA